MSSLSTSLGICPQAAKGTVSVTVADAVATDAVATDDAESDFLASADEGTRTVTIPGADTTAAGADAGTATFTVATIDDKIDEADGEITATVNADAAVNAAPDSGAPAAYTVGDPSTATVAVNDNDEAPPPEPEVSFVSAASSAAESGGDLEIALALDPPPAAALTLRYDIRGSA